MLPHTRALPHAHTLPNAHPHTHPQDKNDKNAVLKPDNITELPSEEALGGTPIDDFKRFWSPDNISTMFGGAAGSVAVPDSTPANTQQ